MQLPNEHPQIVGRRLEERMRRLNQLTKTIEDLDANNPEEMKGMLASILKELSEVTMAIAILTARLGRAKV